MLDLSGVSVSIVTTVLTSKYQKKLSKVTKLVDIITSAIAVFAIAIAILQALHLKVVKELANVDRKMESENRAQFQKILLKEINEIKKTIRMRDTS